MNILIVDDIPLNRKLLHETLEAEGLTIFEAGDGVEALQQLATHPIDVIISDILMPNMDGFRFCYEVRKSKEYSITPFIFYTSTYTSPGDEQLAKEVGGDLYLTKPSSTADLIKAIQDVCESSSSRRANIRFSPNETTIIKEYNQVLVQKLEEKNDELKATSEELKKINEQLSTLFNNLNEVFFSLDINEKKITRISPACEKVYGYPPEAFYQNSMLWKEVIYPDDIAAVLENEQRVLKGELIQEQYRIIRPDGSVCWVEGKVRATLTENGKPIRIDGLISDISERMQSQEQMQKLSKERDVLLRHLQLQFERMPLAYFTVDTDFRIEEWNPTCEKMFGYSKQEVVGKNVYDVIIPASERPLVKQFVSGFIEQNQTQVFVNKNITKEGKTLLCEWHDTPIRNEQGELVGIMAMGQDITDRKIEEEQLKESEERFRLIAETINEVFWISGTNTEQMYYISPSYETVWGRTQSSLYENPKSFLDAVHEEDRSRMVEALTIQKTGEPFDHEYRIIKPDGSIRWIWDRGFPVKNDEGKVFRYVGIAQDITQRKLAEAELAESEERFRLIAETIDEVFWVTEAENDGKYYSPAYERIWGRSCESLYNNPQSFLDSIHKEDKEQVLLTLENQKKGLPFEHEYRIIRPDNSIRWIWDRGFPVQNNKGEVTHFVGVAKDITHKKEAENELLLQTTYFKQLFDSSPIGIVLLDDNDHVVDVNLSFQTMFQFSREEVQNKMLQDLIVPEGKFEEAGNLAVTTQKKENVFMETFRKRKDGSTVDVQIIGFPIFIESKLLGVYAIYVDISERKKLEAQFLQAQKMESIGTLAGGIAHDFNNILAIILGYTNLLERYPDNPEKILQSIEIISKTVHRGAALVRQMLTFARRTESLLEPILINDEVNDIIRLTSETFPKTIEIETQLTDKLPLIIVDRSKFHQVLLNLFVNAHDAIVSHSNRGKIVVKTELLSKEVLQDQFQNLKEELYVKISLADTGIGMDEATKKRIFEPFFTTKEPGKGTGLGLAVVFGVIKSFGGEIDVESTEGKGTTFHIYIPVRKEEPDNREKETEAPTQAKGGTEMILVVEDEESLRDVVSMILEDSGYEVITAGDGEEAINKYLSLKNKISLVISDMGLPKLNGMEVFYKMKKINPDIKTIFASGNLDQDVVSQILKAGVKEIVHKPYQSAELLRVVRRVLDFK